MLDIHPGIRHGTPAKTRSQCRYRGGMTNSRLAVDHGHTQGARNFVGQIASFVRGRRGSQKADRRPAIDELSLIVFRLEVLVPVVLDVLADSRHRPVP